MADRPILFSAGMIRALLDGRKTQTRRILKPQPLMGYTPDVTASKGVRFAKGDRLWVRETLRATRSRARTHSDRDGWAYDADDAAVELDPHDARISAMIAWAHHKEGDTCVSIHMPRWASRLTLTVTDVRVERLQAISEEDAAAEGAREAYGEPFYADSSLTDRRRFNLIWETINGAGSWAKNEWVVALTFSVERRNIDTPPQPAERAGGSG
jgi:hypothetical protein